MIEKTEDGTRDHAMFDAELSGSVVNFHLLGRLFIWLKPYRVNLLASTVLVLIASYAAVVMEILISRVLVDYIIIGEIDSTMPDLGLIDLTKWVEHQTSLSALNSAGVLFFFVMVIFALAGHFHRMTLTSSIVSGLRDLRQDLFSHMETRPSAFYDKVPVGRIMTRITNDIEALFEMLRGMGTLVGEFVPFFVALAIMFSTSVELTMLLLGLLPIVGITTYFFRRASREVFRLIRNSVSSLNQNLQENLSGIEVVQLSGREHKNLTEYTQLNRVNRRQEYSSINLSTFYGAFNDSLTAVGLGLIIWVGAGAVVQDEMTLGGVILFTRFMGMLFTPVVALGEQLNVLFRAMASGERIFQALDWDEQIHEPLSPVTLPSRVKGKIEFQKMTFGYELNNAVLRDVSFSVMPGEKLAIVGPTGSGKSTLIRLLGRFYDFPDGMLLLDGIDINYLKSRDIRKRIGVVLQDFHIFSGSILENISLGDPNISYDRAVRASMTVNAHDFISALPLGYDTVLQERGGNLSQGERQLLAFARVLASDPEILVLDEATASIDTETELLIQDGLKKLIEGRTAILIAHRLQTIQQVDKILVLQNGEVIEHGTQAELLKLRGLYYRLHGLQFQNLKVVID